MEKKFTGVLRTSITENMGSQEGQVIVVLVCIAKGIFGGGCFHAGYTLLGIPITLASLAIFQEGNQAITSFYMVGPTMWA